jgi:hypothetical protein
MDLSPYLEALRRDLAATAAPGGPEVSHAAELLAGSLESSARLGLLEALSDAAAEITAQLETASVEVRLRGREADLVVTEAGPQVDAVPPPTAPQPDGGDLARITLRLPEPLKELVERAASAEGISVNAWLVRAVNAAVQGVPPAGAPPRDRHRAGRRITGFAQA